MGIPTLVPSLSLGFFGSVLDLKSPPKDRNSLFDFAVAGPLGGMFVSILLLTVGLKMGVGADLSTFPRLPVGVLRSSSLGGGLINLLMGGVLDGDGGEFGGGGVPLHPFAVAGFAGLIINALNALPFGTTDGGRAMLALLGRKNFRFAQAFVTPIILLLGLFTGNDNVLFFGAFASILQGGNEILCKDEVSELDNGRLAIVAISFFIVGLSVIPIPMVR